MKRNNTHIAYQNIIIRIDVFLVPKKKHRMNNVKVSFLCIFCRFAAGWDKIKTPEFHFNSEAYFILLLLLSGAGKSS
jgi:hypothetical protein